MGKRSGEGRRWFTGWRVRLGLRRSGARATAGADVDSRVPLLGVD